MSKKAYPCRGMYAMPSTGDASRDNEILNGFVLREKRLIEGICANGCSPMTMLAANERQCSACGFIHWSNRPFEDTENA